MVFRTCFSYIGLANVINMRYINGDFLGSAGELRTANGTIETVAIKVLKDAASKEAEDDFMREVEIMSAFQHENILSLLGVALKGNNALPWICPLLSVYI